MTIDFSVAISDILSKIVPIGNKCKIHTKEYGPNFIKIELSSYMRILGGDIFDEKYIKLYFYVEHYGNRIKYRTCINYGKAYNHSEITERTERTTLRIDEKIALEELRTLLNTLLINEYYVE